MKAKLTNRITGDTVLVHDSTDNSASSYGIPVWEDDKGQAYCQVGMEGFYQVEVIEE